MAGGIPGNIDSGGRGGPIGPDRLDDQAGPMYVGRYVLEGEVASGGMATIYYGRRQDEPVPGTTVAIKRVHPHLARDKRFASMFIDEARLVSRIHHPNVVRTLDIIATESECLLVMEYVHGESLGHLVRLADAQRAPIRVDIISSIVCGALDGLQASHDATNAAGVPLNLVHRDISPQNIMVGADGMARVLDFGVAKAAGSIHVTRDGEIKGKLAYMAPEQLGAKPLDRRTDVYAAGVVLWEALTRQPLFDGDSEAAVVAAVLRQEISPPSAVVPGLSPALDAVVLRALAPDPAARFASAREMGAALEAVARRADLADVAAWVQSLAGQELSDRRQMLESSAARHGQQPKVAPSGTTEVFFTGGPTAAAAAAAPAPAAGRGFAGVLQKGLDGVEAQMTAMVGMLPPNLRAPVHSARWWVVGLLGALIVMVGFAALRDEPKPERSISAAPGSLGPVNGVGPVGSGVNPAAPGH